MHFMAVEVLGTADHTYLHDLEFTTMNTIITIICYNSSITCILLYRILLLLVLLYFISALWKPHHKLALQGQHPSNRNRWAYFSNWLDVRRMAQAYYITAIRPLYKAYALGILNTSGRASCCEECWHSISSSYLAKYSSNYSPCIIYSLTVIFLSSPRSGVLLDLLCRRSREWRRRLLQRCHSSKRQLLRPDHFPSVEKWRSAFPKMRWSDTQCFASSEMRGWVKSQA